MESQPSFEQLNQATEQRSLSRKLAGLEALRQATVDWATQDAVSKGIAEDRVNVVSSRRANRPSSAQLREAARLEINPGTGAVEDDLAEALFGAAEMPAANGIDVDPTTGFTEAQPALKGLRRVISKWRLKRAETKVKDVSARRRVAAHAGTIIIRSRFGEGYYTYADEGGIIQAPRNRRDKHYIDALEELQIERYSIGSKLHKLNALIGYSHGRKLNKRVAARNRLETQSDALYHKINEKAFLSPELGRDLEKAKEKRNRLYAKLNGLPYEQTRTERTRRVAVRGTRAAGRGIRIGIERTRRVAARGTGSVGRGTLRYANNLIELNRNSAQVFSVKDMPKVNDLKPRYGYGKTRTRWGEKYKLQQERNKHGIV